MADEPEVAELEEDLGRDKKRFLKKILVMAKIIMVSKRVMRTKIIMVAMAMAMILMILVTGPMMVTQRTKVKQRRGRNGQDFGQTTDGARDF